MLIGFSFANFMSFYEENIFTMKASSDTKYSELNTVQTNYGELIKSAFVFGANGSGKSNFIKAIAYMKNLVLADLNSQSKMMSAKYFAFHELAIKKPTAFEVVFITNNIMYEYGFEIQDGKVNKEYLYEKKAKRKKSIFMRISPDFNDISLSKEMANVQNLTQNTRQDTLFLYWANGGNNKTAMDVYHWFEKIEIFDTNNITSYPTVEYLLSKNDDGKDNILNLLKTADTHILDFDLSVSTPTKSAFDDSELVPDIKTKHHFYNKDWETSGTLTWSIDFESSGTQKLFDLSGPVIDALEQGKVIFIDEIDSRLHPLLVRFLVMMFNSISKNINDAQLICNTHDLLLLDEDIRRDQIYFTEKNEYGISQLYALTDFKGVRKESKLLRQYLAGLFGATPNIKEYLTFK